MIKMKWIKASEQLPQKSGSYFVRELRPPHMKKILFFSVSPKQKGSFLRTRPWAYEWLDESVPDMNDTGMTFFAR